MAAEGGGTLASYQQWSITTPGDVYEGDLVALGSGLLAERAESGEWAHDAEPEGEHAADVERRRRERAARAKLVFPEARSLSRAERLLMATVPPRWLAAHLWRNGLSCVRVETSGDSEAAVLAEALFRTTCAFRPAAADAEAVLLSLSALPPLDARRARAPAAGPLELVFPLSGKC
jgi:hypothetical protein